MRRWPSLSSSDSARARFRPACTPQAVSDVFLAQPQLGPTRTDFTVSLSPTGFGGGPGFGGVGTGGSSFAFSSTSKPTGGSLSAGTVCVGLCLYSSVVLLKQSEEAPVDMLLFSQLGCRCALAFWFPSDGRCSSFIRTSADRSQRKCCRRSFLLLLTHSHCLSFSLSLAPPGFGGGGGSSGFNFSNPGINPSAGLTFGVSNQPVAGFSTGGTLLQLKKPPAGNKRGKR